MPPKIIINNQVKTLKTYISNLFVIFSVKNVRRVETTLKGTEHKTITLFRDFTKK